MSTDKNKLINTIIMRKLREFAPKKGSKLGIHEFVIVDNIPSKNYVILGKDKHGRELWKMSLPHSFVQDAGSDLERAICRHMDNEWYAFVTRK